MTNFGSLSPLFNTTLTDSASSGTSARFDLALTMPSEFAITSDNAVCLFAFQPINPADAKTSTLPLHPSLADSTTTLPLSSLVPDPSSASRVLLNPLYPIGFWSGLILDARIESCSIAGLKYFLVDHIDRLQSPWIDFDDAVVSGVRLVSDSNRLYLSADRTLVESDGALSGRIVEVNLTCAGSDSSCLRFFLSPHSAAEPILSEVTYQSAHFLKANLDFTTQLQDSVATVTASTITASSIANTSITLIESLPARRDIRLRPSKLAQLGNKFELELNIANECPNFHSSYSIHVEQPLRSADSRVATLWQSGQLLDGPFKSNAINATYNVQYASYSSTVSSSTPYQLSFTLSNPESLASLVIIPYSIVGVRIEVDDSNATTSIVTLAHGNPIPVSLATSIFNGASLLIANIPTIVLFPLLPNSTDSTMRFETNDGEILSTASSRLQLLVTPPDGQSIRTYTFNLAQIVLQDPTPEPAIELPLPWVSIQFTLTFTLDIVQYPIPSNPHPGSDWFGHHSCRELAAAVRCFWKRMKHIRRQAGSIQAVYQIDAPRVFDHTAGIPSIEQGTTESASISSIDILRLVRQQMLNNEGSPLSQGQLTGAIDLTQMPKAVYGCTDAAGEFIPIEECRQSTSSPVPVGLIVGLVSACLVILLAAMIAYHKYRPRVRSMKSGSAVMDAVIPTTVSIELAMQDEHLCQSLPEISPTDNTWIHVHAPTDVIVEQESVVDPAANVATKESNGALPLPLQGTLVRKFRIAPLKRSVAPMPTTALTIVFTIALLSGSAVSPARAEYPNGCTPASPSPCMDQLPNPPSFTLDPQPNSFIATLDVDLEPYIDVTEQPDAHRLFYRHTVAVNEYGTTDLFCQYAKPLVAVDGSMKWDILEEYSRSCIPQDFEESAGKLLATCYSFVEADNALRALSGSAADIIAERRFWSTEIFRISCRDQVRADDGVFRYDITFTRADFHKHVIIVARDQEVFDAITEYHRRLAGLDPVGMSAGVQYLYDMRDNVYIAKAASTLDFSNAIAAGQGGQSTSTSDKLKHCAGAQSCSTAYSSFVDACSSRY